MAQQEPGNKTIPPKLLLSSPPEETERATPAVRGVKDQTDAQMFCSLCVTYFQNCDILHIHIQII